METAYRRRAAMLALTRHGRSHVGLNITSLALALVGVGPASAQSPRVGTVQITRVITISLQVGSTEKESRHVTYSPPPGWYVRSQRVDVLAKIGPASYAVNTVPEDWSCLTEDNVRESYRTLLELAGQSRGQQLQSKYALERDALLMELSQVRSAHHALVVDATARGEGFLRRGGRLELSVIAELVYVGTQETLQQKVAQAKSATTLEKEGGAARAAFASAAFADPANDEPSTGQSAPSATAAKSRSR
jgi:hypothetical protein